MRPPYPSITNCLLIIFLYKAYKHTTIRNSKNYLRRLINVYSQKIVFNQSAEGVLNVLEYKGWLVRTVFVQNQLWWVLSDVCNVIHLSNASSAAARLDECEKMTLTQTSSHSGQRGGAQKLLLINVFGLCHLLDTSRKPAAKAFRRWNMTEAMPSILQNGGYILGQNSMDADELRDATDSFARNVLAARDQQVQELLLENKEQAALLREWEPKVRYYDAVLCIQGALPISVIAKGYGVSAQAMNRYLHDRMVQYKRAGTWLLYQPYADRGYTQSHPILCGSPHCREHTYWTPKGREIGRAHV